MNYLKLIVGMIIISLLVGCSTTEVSETEPENIEEITEVSRDEGVGGGIGEVKEEKEEILEVKIEGLDNEAKAKDIFSVADKARFYPTSKKLEVGDKYQYILGITNPNSEPFVGITTINFKEGSSKGLSNKLDADENTMNSWLEKTDYGYVMVEPNSITYLPVIVTVKDKISKTLDTTSGSYSFEVIVIDNSTAYKTHESDWEVYHKDTFTIVVS